MKLTFHSIIFISTKDKMLAFKYKTWKSRKLSLMDPMVSTLSSSNASGT